MGELPLSVAALTFNLEMVDLLLGHGAKLHEVNTRGDTVLHSLVRFIHHYPDQEAQVAEMMREIHSRLQAPETAPSPQVRTEGGGGKGRGGRGREGEGERGEGTGRGGQT